ncbi:hypothetical protein GOODEAATRI_027574 [Goodea atripinnis]|uniref:Uncharacterized protein n=1 Tax=Goodea atripinnis TaxID=208336 RepID=A0ABV0NNQ2_9TELE
MISNSVDSSEKNRCITDGQHSVGSWAFLCGLSMFTSHLSFNSPETCMLGQLAALKCVCCCVQYKSSIKAKKLKNPYNSFHVHPSIHPCRVVVPISGGHLARGGVHPAHVADPS